MVRDATSPLPEGAGHIMSMALLASEFGYLDLTQKSILFLMPTPRGVSGIGVTAAPAAAALSTPTPPVGGGLSGMEVSVDTPSSSLEDWW